jgi:hypothetical protein
MPRATVWIRTQDWDKWGRVQNKSELVSQAINRSVRSQEIKEPVLDSPKADRPVGKDYSLCAHSQVRGFCKQGCK